eukprot:scaffold11454_cov168-Amphora_coffeaeformis.AAC.8
MATNKDNILHYYWKDTSRVLKNQKQTLLKAGSLFAGFFDSCLVSSNIPMIKSKLIPAIRVRNISRFLCGMTTLKESNCKRI